MWPFKKKFQLLIVCRHNITRSAYFAGYLKHYLKQYRPGALRNISIVSSGVMAKDGFGANSTIRFIAKQNGFSLDTHRSTALTPKLVDRSDLILTMSENQKTFFHNEYPQTDGHVFKLMEFGLGEKTEYINAHGEKTSDLNMPDPTGRDAADFEEFIALANNEADRVLHELAHLQLI
jgi:protein-tyrosine-phosphatase